MGDRLKVVETPLAGLCVVQSLVLADARGNFARLFCSKELEAAWGARPIAQVNLSTTVQPGTIRGMHYQRDPHAEAKLVRCLRGAAWDVAVDLRRGSPTFLRWHAERLTPGNARAMLIPEGFAHGFQALTADVEMLYCHSASFAPAAEAGLHPLDPRLGIEWPVPVAAISARDEAHPLMDDSFAGEPA